MGTSVRLLGLGLAAICGCTTFPWRPYRGWTSNQSATFTVYTDAITAHRFSQEWLELSDAAYHAFFPWLPQTNVDVLFMQSDPKSLTRFYRPNDSPSGAWALETLPRPGRIGQNGLLVLETRDHHSAARTLAHHLIGKAIPNAPMWLQIGLARYMAGQRIHYQGNAWIACFGNVVFPNRPGNNTRDIMLPVHELFTSDWYRINDDGRFWYSYTAYALIHFLVQGRKGFHASRFPVMLDAIARGKSSAEALALAYPHLLEDEWDEELAAYVRPAMDKEVLAGMTGLPQGLCYRIPPAYHAQMRPRRTDVPEAEIRQVLEDLERIDLFRTHNAWMPADVVAAQAAKRGGRGGGGGGGTSGGSGSQKPQPDPSTPTIRTNP